MAYGKSPSSDERWPWTTLTRLKNTLQEALLTPLRIATSKYALRAYITSILFAATALVLLFFAIAAYVLFYWSYIPRIGFERVIHLQFDALPAVTGPSITSTSTSTTASAPHPWGIAYLAPDVASTQRYDIKVELTLPRTPSNTAMGNFMLDVKLHAPVDRASVSTLSLAALKTGLLASSGGAPQQATAGAVLAHSRRPAIMTYYSPLVELVHRASQLHWYVLGWRREAETLTISMFEGVEFGKGWRNVPASLRLEIQSAGGAQAQAQAGPQHMQVYAAKVLFRARFHGLRWLMYNHRIASAGVFIVSFWLTEVACTAMVWLGLSVFLFSGSKAAEQEKGRMIKSDDGSDVSVKEEEEQEEEEGQEDVNGMSDTERTFPTYGSQPPLRYLGSAVGSGGGAGFKKEDWDEGAKHHDEKGLFEQVPPANLAAEADDEDEDADFVLDDGRWPDSGLGTSMESGAGRRESVVRRRRSRPEDREKF